MSLAEKLVSLRKQKGFTQMELAERLNISRQAISRWEVGAAVPSTDNLIVLSELYGVSVDYLLYDAADNSNQNTECQVRESNEKNRKNRSKKFRYIGVCATALIMIILIITFVMTIQGQSKDQEQVTPIGEMDTIVEDDYTVYGFSFG